MRRHPINGIGSPQSAIVLGTGGFGSAVLRDEAFAMLDAFASAGGTLIDTAHVYAAWLPQGVGASERTIGAWLRTRGPDHGMTIATKGGHPPLDDMSRSRLRPEDLAADIADSLERLDQPAVGLYWLHRDDERIPVDEILDALQPLLRDGRIGAIGASNWSWQRLAAAQACASVHGWTGFSASQICWSLASPAPDFRFTGGMVGMDEATLAFHVASGLPQIPYSAQANGFFAKDLDQAMRLSRYAHPDNVVRWHLVQELAQRHGVSANAIALAWLLQHPQGGFAIIGPRNRAQLADSLVAADLTLEVADWERLAPV